MDDRLPNRLALLLLLALTATGCSRTSWQFVREWSGHHVPVEQQIVEQQIAEPQLAAMPPASSEPIRRLPTVEVADSTRFDVQLTSHDKPVDLANALATMGTDVEQAQFPGEIVSPSFMDASPDAYPIDLANALQLGGASNLEVRLARSRVAEAQARHLAAKSLWLPSLRFGVGYNKHDGRLQETEGNVLEVSRNSLFFGGGAGLGTAPLAGGSSGPFRFAVNLSLADAAFAPLVEKQRVNAAGSAGVAALNDNLLAIAAAYFTLVEAHGRLANQHEALGAVEKMVEQVAAFKKAGMSSDTELQRVQTELASRRRQLADAERRITSASAQLAQLVRLPPQITLTPVEDFVLPVPFFDAAQPVESLIAQAQSSRPEVSQAGSQLQAACWRNRQEKWRPWLPNLQAGASAGSFGGGTGSNFENNGGRSDVDLIAIWELQNMGAGNTALRRETSSQFHQRELELEQVRDQVAAEVVSAHADVQSFAQQLAITEEAIRAAEQSYHLNASRIQEGEGLPIELIQSLTALATAQEDYTAVVANHNRSQYRLMRAVGQAPAAE